MARGEAGALGYATVLCAGGICTHITGLMYSEPAVGLFSMGDEVVGQIKSDAISWTATRRFQHRDRISAIQSMYSDRQSPFVFPIMAQRGVRRDGSFTVNVVPADSWACTMTIQRGKKFRRSSSYEDVIRTGQLDSQRRRWESNPLHNRFAGGRRAVWLQRHVI